MPVIGGSFAASSAREEKEAKPVRTVLEKNRSGNGDWKGNKDSKEVGVCG